MTRIKDKTDADPRVNLARLATYLEKLPADYEQFEMSSFVEDADPVKVQNYVVNNGSVASCGTAACAVGHGPAAHMFFNSKELLLLQGETPWNIGEAWMNYARRVFDTNTLTFEWMFGGCWASVPDDSVDPVDNTVRGAAARIRYFLAHGVPEDFEEDAPQDSVADYAGYLVP